MTKPYRGELFNWRKVACDEYGYDTPTFGAEGYYYILGFTSEQLKKLGTVRATSRVVQLAKLDGYSMVETLNSFYKLVGEVQC